MLKPKMLRKTTDGRLFAYTDALASRPDMIPVWENDVDPNWVRPERLTMTGELVAEEQTTQLRTVLYEKEELIKKLTEQIDSLTEDIMSQNEEIAKLNKMLFSPPDEVEAIPDEPMLPKPDFDRKTMLVAAAKKLMAIGGTNNITARGQLRIEALEEESGLTGVTSTERDAAQKEAEA
jgi:hypothetical protein